MCGVAFCLSSAPTCCLFSSFPFFQLLPPLLLSLCVTVFLCSTLYLTFFLPCPPTAHHNQDVVTLQRDKLEVVGREDSARAQILLSSYTIRNSPFVAGHASSLNPSGPITSPDESPTMPPPQSPTDRGGWLDRFFSYPAHLCVDCQGETCEGSLLVMGPV